MSTENNVRGFKREMILETGKAAYCGVAFGQHTPHRIVVCIDQAQAAMTGLQEIGPEFRSDLCTEVAVISLATFRAMALAAGWQLSPLPPPIDPTKPAPKADLKRVPHVGRRRRAIFEESAGKCHYCACELELTGKWHVEHKMPRALGGEDEPGNLVASCVPCNMKKRDTTDVEFKARLAKEAA